MSSFDVGYKKPPIEHQFTPGKSGNPKGRPKGAKGLATLLPKALSETVVIDDNGKPRRFTKLELAIRQAVNKAAKGDLKALKQLLQMLKEVEARADGQKATSILSEGDREVLKLMPTLYGLPPEYSKD